MTTETDALNEQPDWLDPPRPAPMAAAAPTDRLLPEDTATPEDFWVRRFWLLTLVSVALGAVGRLVYLFTSGRTVADVDGLTSHAGALRLADGFSYTLGFGTVSIPDAHAPPGWTTVLGAASWLGGRSVRSHQLVGVLLGLALVVLAALIGRRYFSSRAGIAAAVFTALYPGFWLLARNLRSESLSLVLLAVLLLLVGGLRDNPTWARTVSIGAVAGLLALSQTDQLAVAALVIVPTLLATRSLSVAQRCARVLVVGVVAVGLLVPWSVYNAGRFKAVVPLSTGTGISLLQGNCTPGSFTGPRLGSLDTSCGYTLTAEHPRFDESQVDSAARRAAWNNVTDHADRLMFVVGARLGRLLAVYRPGQTVDLVAASSGVDPWVVWAWAGAFWVLLVLAGTGAVLARRRNLATWPLLAPFVVAVLEMLAFHGEPVAHAMGDIGLIVLAGYAVDRVLGFRRSGAEPPRPGARSAGKARASSPNRPARLPSVYLGR